MIGNNGPRFFSYVNWYAFLSLYLHILTTLQQFVLSYVGVASSIGLAVELPIILRSLADSLALVDEKMLPLNFDQDFLLMLDIGAHNDDNDSQVVKKYERSWWIGKKPRNLDLIEILDKSSITRCLETHQHQLLPSRRGIVVEN